MSTFGQRCVQTALPVLVLLGCAPEMRTPESADLSLPAVEAELQSIWAEYSAAVTAGDVERLTALYADSIYFMEPGLPTLRTRASLTAAAKDALAGVRIIEARIIPEFTEFRGSAVAQYGSYADLLELPGQSPIRKYGRYAALAERDSAGTWRLVRLTSLVDSTPPL